MNIDHAVIYVVTIADQRLHTTRSFRQDLPTKCYFSPHCVLYLASLSIVNKSCYLKIHMNIDHAVIYVVTIADQRLHTARSFRQGLPTKCYFSPHCVLYLASLSIVNKSCYILSEDILQHEYHYAFISDIISRIKDNNTLYGHSAKIYPQNATFSHTVFIFSSTCNSCIK